MIRRKPAADPQRLGIRFTADFPLLHQGVVMKLSKLATFARKRSAISAFVVCTGLLVGGVFAERHSSSAGSTVASERGHEPDGKGEKQATGMSFEKQTRVERFSGPSAYSSLLDAERVWSGNDDWEPALAVHPTNPNIIYQATTRYSGKTKPCSGCPYPFIVIRQSTDGGNTWGPDKYVPDLKYKQNDPEIEVATDGTLYAAWMDDYIPGVAFAKSTNGGTTWTTPVRLTLAGMTPNQSDKPLLAISSNGQNVYVALNDAVMGNHFIASSHNYGASFVMSPQLNNDNRYWFDIGGAVAPNGSVYFLTSDFTQDYTGDANISVVSSSNGGTTWTRTVVDTSKQMPDCPWSTGCYLGFFGTIGGLAVDSAGNIMIAYNANNVASSPMQLYAKKSTNGGSTWSARMDIGGGAAVNHHSVAVAAGSAAGSFAVVWQDDRMGANTAWNAWMRRTTNGGTTWDAPLRLSDQATGAPYKTAAGHKFPYGDYQEVGSDNAGHYYAIWGEGASYKGPGGTWYTKTY
jgi:hypothetical protein